MKIETIIALIFCPFGISLILFGIWEVVTPRRIRKSGVHTRGRVAHVHTTKYMGKVSYHYTISFVTRAGQPVTCKKTALGQISDMRIEENIFDVGDTADIYYLEKSPEKIYLENDRMYMRSIMWILLGIFILVLGLIAVLSR